MLESWTRYEITVEQSGFEIRLSGVWRRWHADADLFIIGLVRRYMQGPRAEGVKVAEMLWKVRKKVLIVGSESNDACIGVPFYWDLASNGNILEAVGSVLDEPVPKLADQARFLKAFEKRTEKPLGHGEKSKSR